MTHSYADDAALVVTELGANAITHTASGDGSFLLAVTHAETTVTITVTDAGGTTSRPHIEYPAKDSCGGRGLALVTSYATKVHISGDHYGHTVTAELHPNSTAPETC